ncbi:hypothetical protein HK105_207141 [Polyrhizophydium stewartii]|uniref:SMAD/FHA domain-containing protein n=1 Tax=Polyrhizophydium stewartii TaxID=2732419 RepID=A0ABR4N1S0_9FUNG
MVLFPHSTPLHLQIARPPAVPRLPQNRPAAAGPDAPDAGSPSTLYVAFRSKVVSRAHAEIWAGKDGQIYFRDVGSSSGTFLNRLRLSPSGKESRPYTVKSGDIIQLGVDYQGRTEEIYKAVMIKVFITVKSGAVRKPDPSKLKDSIRSLISSMNPSNPDPEAASVDCCICLGTMAPLQALFLAPCSHCFHYKCVTPLLGSGYMFQCPLCRQVANLDASVAIENEDGPIVIEEEIHLERDKDDPLNRATSRRRPNGSHRHADADQNAALDAQGTHDAAVVAASALAPPPLPLAAQVSEPHEASAEHSSDDADHPAAAAANTTATMPEPPTSPATEEVFEFEVGSPTTVHASRTLMRRGNNRRAPGGPMPPMPPIMRSDSEHTQNEADASANGGAGTSSSTPIAVPAAMPGRTGSHPLPMQLSLSNERIDALMAATPPNHNMMLPPSNHGDLTAGAAASGAGPAGAAGSASSQGLVHHPAFDYLPSALSSLADALARGDRTAASIAIDNYTKLVTDMFGDLRFAGSDEERDALRARLIESLPVLRR